MRDHINRRVTPPKRVASHTWGTPLPCKRALKLFNKLRDSPRWHLPKSFPSVFTSDFINVRMPDSVVNSQARQIKEKLDLKLISERN